MPPKTHSVLSDCSLLAQTHHERVAGEALRRTNDAEFLHLGLERGALAPNWTVFAEKYERKAGMSNLRSRSFPVG